MNMKNENCKKRDKTLVFIPTPYYLSHPLFLSMVENLWQYKNVYFNTKDPISWEYDKKGIQKEEILKYFDDYYEVDRKISYEKNIFGKIEDYYLNKKDITDRLNKIAPIAIINISDMTYSARVCRQWADRNNIPVITIQPSFLDFGIPDYSLLHKIKYVLFNKILNLPLFRRQTYYGNENKKTYLFLWGEYFKRYYKGKSVYNNIYITGNPAFDKYFADCKKSKNAEVYKIIPISPDKKIITICTQNVSAKYGTDAFIALIELYKHVISHNEHLFFVVKVHPREDIEKYKKTLSDLTTDNYIVVKYVNLHNLYTITDVQVSVSSYSSFEAIIFGIPIILINPNNLFDFFDYFNGEIELKAIKSEDLTNNIRICLKKEYRDKFKSKRERYLRSRLCSLDGKSGKRVRKAIEEILSTKDKEE